MNGKVLKFQTDVVAVERLEVRLENAFQASDIKTERDVRPHDFERKQVVSFAPSSSSREKYKSQDLHLNNFKCFPKNNIVIGDVDSQDTSNTGMKFVVTDGINT